jgi:hypothetical protein
MVNVPRPFKSPCTRSTVLSASLAGLEAIKETWVLWCPLLENLRMILIQFHVGRPFTNLFKVQNFINLDPIEEECYRRGFL